MELNKNKNGGVSRHRGDGTLNADMHQFWELGKRVPGCKWEVYFQVGEIQKKVRWVEYIRQAHIQPLDSCRSSSIAPNVLQIE